MLKKILTNHVVHNTFILFIYTFILELIIRHFTNVAIFEAATIRIALSSLIMALIWSMITNLCNKVIARILNILYVAVVGIFEFIEFGLFNYLGFFMGIGNSDQGTKVLGYINDFIHSLKPEHWLILVPVVFFIIFYLTVDRLILKNKDNDKKPKFAKKAIVSFVALIFVVLLSGCYYLTVKSTKMQNSLQTEKNYYIWLYPENSNLAVNNFGVAVYFFCDVKSQINNIDADYIMELEMADEAKEAEKKKEKTTTVVSTDENEEVVDYTRHIDDSAWELLAENTTDSTTKTLNTYFMNREIYDKNEMTGKFKDKNLIVILMESVNEISVLNEDYFPTLYKLYNEGISFHNNYSPRNNCSTGNNEFTVLTSLFTINNTCTANTYKNNSYYEAAFNMFKNAGYTATAYHDYTLKYYFRNTYLPNMGATKFYSVKDLGIAYDDKYEEWPDDSLLFQEAKKYYMSDGKFFAYFATVSTHQTYNVSSTLGDKYRKKYEDLGYSKTLSRYLSKMQVLDEALAELLAELEAEGKLDDTVIALFGDHFPYGLTDNQVNEFLTKNNAGYTINRNSTTEKNVDKTPLIIYNSASEPMVVNDYTSIIDLLPTLFNLFDIDYDPRLYLGTDIFSSAHKSRTVFADGSWADENGFYYAPSSKMTYNDNATKTYTTEELKEINSEITKRQKMSASALKTNYFKYLGDGLKKYQAIIDEQNKVTTTTTSEISTESTTSSSEENEESEE